MRELVQVYGYDLDVSSKPTVHVRDQDGTEVSVSQYVQIPTHYMMTINVLASGFPFKPTSHSLVIRWGGKILGDVAPSSRRRRAETRAIRAAPAAPPAAWARVPSDGALGLSEPWRR